METFYNSGGKHSKRLTSPLQNCAGNISSTVRTSMQSFWKKGLVLSLFLLAGLFGYAQTATVGTGTSTQRYPLGNLFGFERSAAIYTAAEIGLTGDISKLGWYVTSNSAVSRPIKIYLKSTTSSTITANTWPDQIAGATLVYDGSKSLVGNSWNEFTLTTAFSYSGGSNNLVVMVEANIGGPGNGNSSGSVRFSTATDKHKTWQKDGSAPITEGGNLNSNRPNIQISIPASVAPNCATSHFPLDLATNVAVNPTLTWANGGGAASYDVYFGTAANPAFIANQTSMSYVAGALNANTQYYWKIVPKNAFGSAIGCLERSFTTGTSYNYCAVSTQYVSDYTSAFSTTLANANVTYTASSQPAGSYANETAKDFKVAQGGTFNFSHSYVSGPNGVKIWIDYNNNGTFESSEAVFFLWNSASIKTGSITVPFSTSVGTYRMRVRSQYGFSSVEPPACGSVEYGSTVDYSLVVLATTPCAGTPDAAVVTSSVANVCVSGPVTLTAALPSSTAPGLQYQWYNTAGAISGANASTYTTTVFSSDSFYFITTCTNGGLTATSNTVSVAVSTPQVLSSTANSRCGTGTVTLSATASSGATLNWYATATGGSSLATGESFTTPSISGTTNYYVSATIDGCSTSRVMVTATVNAAPSAIVVSPVTAIVCAGEIQALTATGGTIGASASGTVGTATTLTGATDNDTAFNNRYKHYWMQMVFTKAELNAAGVQAGNINGIKFKINSLGDGSSVSDYRIHMGSTSATVLSTLTTVGLTEVFTAATYNHTVGVNSIGFTTPYVWDGMSNVIVDIRSTGANAIYNAQTYYTATTDYKTVYATTTSTFPSSNAFAASNPTRTRSYRRLNTTFDYSTSVATDITWSPATNLFTDAAATVAYVAGANASTVYVKSANSVVQNYIATATSPSGLCASSANVEVTVNETPAPTAENQTLCQGATVADLVATGTNIVWYADMNIETAFESDIVLETGTYYAAQFANGCESARIAVNVVIVESLATISPISGPAVIMPSNLTATYSVEAVSGATSYVWTLPAGMSSADLTGSSITVDIDAAFISGEISVKAINSCGETATSSLTVEMDQSGNIPTTSLTAAYCGATGLTPSGQVRANGVMGAAGYRFNIYDASGSTLLAFIDNTYAFFRLAQIDFTYGATYQVKVQVKQGNLYGAEGAACGVTVMDLPVLTLGSYCGALNVTPSQQVRADGALNATGFRFNIYDTTGSTLLATITNQYSFFRFTQMNFVYGATYLVKVQVKQGEEFGVEGAGCLVAIMDIPMVTLASSSCGAMNVAPSDQVRANGVNNATGYRFNIYDAAGSTLVATLENSFAFFRFAQMAYTDGATYQVKVQAKQGQVYGAEGAACSVTLSAAEMATRQDGGLSSNSDMGAMDFKAVAYPNPFAENFKLAITSDSDATIQVRVYDMIGKLLEDKMVKATDIQAFELGNRYPSGVYNVIVTQDSNQKTVRVIKR